MVVQSIDDLERQVALAELGLPALEASYHVDTAAFVELEDLAGTIEDALTLVRPDAGSEHTVERLADLQARMIVVLAA